MKRNPSALQVRSCRREAKRFDVCLGNMETITSVNELEELAHVMIIHIVDGSTMTPQEQLTHIQGTLKCLTIAIIVCGLYVSYSQTETCDKDDTEKPQSRWSRDFYF